MKTKLAIIGRATLWVLLSTLIPQPSTCSAQGSLTPPGAPAPTMKSLDQVEARAPISSAPFTITNPGSYYLTKNLTVSSGNAITIATNGVSLDLNGFTIASTAASATGTAIQLNSRLHNITIRNGFLQGGVTNFGGVYSGSGFAYGISYAGFTSANVLISRITVSSCLYNGINIGFGSSVVVEDCRLQTLGGSGVYATTIRNCVATSCGGSGIYGVYVSDSGGDSDGSGYGVFAGSMAQNCYAANYGTGKGLYTTVAQNCYGYSGTQPGITATTALNCYGSSDSSYGISSYVAQGCYGYSSTSVGIHGVYSAENCYGESDGNFDAISCNAALNCYGVSNGNGNGISASEVNTCGGHSHGSGNGINATTVLNSVGTSDYDIGIYTVVAVGSSATGVGTVDLQATIASLCDAPSNSVAHKYNMP